MRVYTFDNAGVAFIPETGWNTPSGPRQGWADQIPTVGYWKVGDKLVIGRETIVCVAEGLPGTWEFTVERTILGTGGIRHVPFLLKSRTGIITTATQIQPGQVRVNFFPNFSNNSEYVVVANSIQGEGTSGDVILVIQKSIGYFLVLSYGRVTGALVECDSDFTIIQSALNPITPLPA